MNKGTLPIVARLRSLQAAARFVPGGGRVIAEIYDSNPLAQLLRVANETMLGRSLQFESAAGPSLTLDVAGRRVLRLTSAIGLPGAESCLGVEVLEDEHKDDLIKLLQALAAPRQELWVTAGPIGRGGEEVSVGLPVALLADLVLIDLNKADDADLDPEPVIELAVPEPEPITTVPDRTAGTGGGTNLAGFADAFGPDLLAWLIARGGDSGKSSGPEEMVTHLQGFLDDEIESVDRQLDLLSAMPGDPICMILGATLVEGHSILCARLRSDLLLGVIEGDSTRATLDAWRRAIG